MGFWRTAAEFQWIWEAARKTGQMEPGKDRQNRKRADEARNEA
jgi:hypothetical protein